MTPRPLGRNAESHAAECVAHDGRARVYRRRVTVRSQSVRAHNVRIPPWRGGIPPQSAGDRARSKPVVPVRRPGVPTVQGHIARGRSGRCQPRRVRWHAPHGEHAGESEPSPPRRSSDPVRSNPRLRPRGAARQRPAPASSRAPTATFVVRRVSCLICAAVFCIVLTVS